MAIEALASTAAVAPSREPPQVSAQDKAQGDAFAQQLAAQAQPATSAPVSIPISALQSGGQAGLGEQILGSLQKFGQTVGKMEEMGMAKPGRTLSDGQAASVFQPSAPLLGPVQHNQGGNRPQTADENIKQALGKAEEALGHQAQLYGVMMDFTLVHSSAESLNKSLKTLLTQGGG